MSTEPEPNGPQVRVDPAEVDIAWLREAVATNRHFGSQARRTNEAIEALRRAEQDSGE
jgi:hypothetical protein